jgi:hypothetical protein
MRRFSLLALLVAALAVGSAGPAAAHDRCAKKGSRTAASTHRVRVYWAHYEMGNGARGDALYGCVRKTGAKRALFHTYWGIGNDYQEIRHLRVNRYWVAFSSWESCTVCKLKQSYDAVHVAELLSGKRRVLENARDYDRRKHGVSVDALVLDRCGRVAYRAQLTDTSGRRESADQPHLLTWIRGKRRLVDQGDVERDSIHFAPSFLHWRRDGVERSAPVAPTCS